jgi:hypothetical protein
MRLAFWGLEFGFGDGLIERLVVYTLWSCYGE